MTLSDLAVRRPVSTGMVIAAFVIFGAIGFRSLGVSYMPDVDFPTVTVSTAWPGADPEQVETAITEKLEDAISTVEGIKHVRSANRAGQSSITVEFDLGRDIDVGAQDVRDKVSGALRKLPLDAEVPVVAKTDINAFPILWITLYGDRPIKELTEHAEDVVKPRLQQRSGVGEVNVRGGRRREVRIWLSAERLAQYRVTAQDVAAAIAAQNLDVPGGKLEAQVTEKIIKVKGRLPSPFAFNDVIVAYDGGPVRLKQVGYAEDGMEDKTSVARYVDASGAAFDCVGLGISAQAGANQVEVARGVKREVAKLARELPPGMRIAVVSDATGYIEQSIGEVEQNLVLGGLLAALVILFFLQNVGTTLISALSIPVSIVGTFALMRALGFTLNNFTLLGLTLAVGVVIDDAIIVIENIYRHREEGLGAMEATLRGAREITFAAAASTFSLCAVFVPVAFMRGMVGKFLFEFGLTVAIAILISLLVALTLVPMLASRWLRLGTGRFVLFRAFEAAFRGVRRAYERLLAASLRRPWAVAAGALLVFAGSVAAQRALEKELMPQEDMSRFIVRIEAPIDYTVDATDRAADKVLGIVRGLPEMKNVFGTIGMGGGGSAQVNSGMLFVGLTDKSQRRRGQQEIMAQVRRQAAAVPDVFARVMSVNLMTRGFRSADLEYLVQGPRLDELDALSTKVMAGLRGVPGVVDVDRDLRLGKPELQVRIDREKAAAAGVPVAAIARTVSALVGGEKISDYTEGGKTYDVRLRLAAGDRTVPGDIAGINVRAASGSFIGLTSLVRLVPQMGPNVINRTDRRRSVTLSGNLQGAALGTALARLEGIVKETLPEGYEGRPAGTTEMLGETFANLLFALLLAVLLTYMILASQFESLLHPFTVMLTLPLATVGAFGALLAGSLLDRWGAVRLGGMTVNMFSMIGVILLVGLVTKNAILLIDCTGQLRARGMGVVEALAVACPTRLRPILMTAASTIAGTLPVVLGLGEGAESRRPMGVAILGGMISSTLLTLVVIPAVYLLLERARARLARRRAA